MLILLLLSTLNFSFVSNIFFYFVQHLNLRGFSNLKKKTRCDFFGGVENSHLLSAEGHRKCTRQIYHILPWQHEQYFLS